MAKRLNSKAKPAPQICIVSNNPTPFKATQIQLLYQAAFTHQLAYMDGMHPDTGEIVPLLVGIEPETEAIHPLAVLLNKHTDDIPNYLVPDGRGSYFKWCPEEESGATEQGQSTETGESTD